MSFDFKCAYYRQESKEIEIDEYIKDIHLGDIYCPDCKNAELIHKTSNKGNNFFSTKNGQKEFHLKECQHSATILLQSKLRKMFTVVDSKSKTREIINSNLNAIKKLLLDKNDCFSEKAQSAHNILIDDLNIKSKQINEDKESVSNIYYIPRIKLNRLKKDKFENEGIYAVWGEGYIWEENIFYLLEKVKKEIAELKKKIEKSTSEEKSELEQKIKEIEIKNKKTSIKLSFKLSKDEENPIATMLLSSDLLKKYYQEKKKKEFLSLERMCKFVFITKITLSEDKYINMRISSTEDMYIFPPEI